MCAKKLIYLLILLLMSFPVPSIANEPVLDLFPSIRRGMGARGQSMGGTGVVTDDQISAVFSNPALCNLSKNKWNFLLSGSLSRTERDGLPQPINCSIGGGKGFNFPALGIGMDEIFVAPSLAFNGYVYWIGGLDIIKVAPITKAPIPLDRGRQLLDHAIFLTFSTPIGYTEERWVIGLNGFLFKRELYDINSNYSFGWDFGSILRLYEGGGDWFTPPVNLGIRYRQLSSLKWRYPVKRIDDPWSYIDAGIEIGKIKFTDKTNLDWAVQFRFDQNKELRAGFGGEFQCETFSIPFGCEDVWNSQKDAFKFPNITFGVRLPFKSFEFDIAFRVYAANPEAWQQMDGQFNLNY